MNPLSPSARRKSHEAKFQSKWFGLRFVHPETEQAFLWSWLRATLRIRTTWAISATLVYVAYSSLIYYASSIAFTDLHWFRFLVVLPIFASVVFVVTREKATPLLCETVYAIMSTAAFANASFCYAMVEGEPSLLFLYEMAAVFVCSMLYFPGLFRPIAIFIGIGTAISFVTFWHVWLKAGQDWVAISVQSSLLLGLTFSGFAAAFSKEILIRRNYRARQIEERQRSEAERLARAADTASEAKSRFVAMVGHEFRTPLNAIMGYSEILQLAPGRNWKPERVNEYMSDIFHSAQHLHRLVENVLTVTNGTDEALKANLEPVELNSVVSRIAGANLIKADGRGIQLTQSYGADRLEVSADHWMVAHMLDELISNALKFTSPGGRLDIEVMPRRDGGGDIRVSDNGVGISEDMQARVLEPFTQSDSDLDRSHDGLGLGLALVQNMALAQNGRIKLSSKLGEGTSVLVTFTPPDRETLIAAAGE
jgi:signal transduction histidine kinase